jgi:hypothetical protein
MSDEQQKGAQDVAETPVVEATPEERIAGLAVIPGVKKSAWKPEYQKNRKDKKAKESFVFSSATEPNKAEAKRLLSERIQNQHVLDFCYDLALNAAEQNGVSPNRFYFQNGYRKTIASLEAKAPQTLEAIPADEEVEGEILYRADLYALFDYGFWRHPDVSFEQWLADRRKFKSSAFEMSKILGKEDFGAKHEEWTTFAPRWNPVGLRPGYTQKQALTWLDSQRSDTEGDKKRYLLVASRNSMKSTWVRILGLCLTITLPDAPILVVSETNKLSKKGMKELKGYLEMVPNNPSLFQQYFGEFTIPPDSGQSLVYENPLAHLGMPQNSIEQSSMESANTGSRFWFAIFDDPISRDNGTRNEEQRAEAVSKHGSITKLRDPAGFYINVQTPWVADDLGDVMIQRNSEDDEHPLAVRIDPVFEMKPDVVTRYSKLKGVDADKFLLCLTENDINLNFLPKLNWRFVRDEMRSPEGIRFFRSQYLCEWLHDEEGLRVTFAEEDLRAHLRRTEFFGSQLGAQTHLVLDRAYSIQAWADYSALCVLKVMPVTARDGVKPKTSCVVWDACVERMKESELVKKVVDFMEQYKPTSFTCEKDKGHEALDLAIRKLAMLRGVPLPYMRWTATNPGGSRTQLQKAKRIKKLESPLATDLLWFRSSGGWTDIVFQQFCTMNGIFKDVNSKKIDAPDAISLGYEQFMPRTLMEPEDPESAQQKKQDAEREFERERMRAAHAAHFGQGGPTGHVTTGRGWGNNRPTDPTPANEPAPTAPRHFPRGGHPGFSILPGGMRRGR